MRSARCWSRTAPTVTKVTVPRARVDPKRSSAKSAASRKLAVVSVLLRRPDGISRPAYRLDQPRLAVLIDLGAEAADLRLDDLGTRLEVELPDVLEDHRAGDDAAGVAHEVLEEAIL